MVTLKTILFVLSLSVIAFACEKKKKETKTKNNDSKNSDEPASYWVGTYTKKEGHVDGKAAGILHLEVNLDDLSASKVTIANGSSINPSYLIPSPNGTMVYAIQEIGPADADDGYVIAYQIQGDTLIEMNRQPTSGFAPCHVSINEANNLLVVSNYMGETLSTYALNEDGTISPPLEVKKFHGKSDHPRQEASHIHSAFFSPDNTSIWACDLGANKVYGFTIDKDKKLKAVNEDGIELPKYAGPRHLAFHPTEPVIFVANELSKTVSIIKYGKAVNQIKLLATVPSFDVSKDGSLAAIKVSKDGTKVFISNRGVDSISIFAFDKKTNALNLIQQVSTHGKTPRDFLLDEENKLLLIANQDDSSVTFYPLDDHSMPIKDRVVTIPVDTPVCLKKAVL